MINISITERNNNIIAIEAKGHSGYAKQGSDIVCSAVSTLMQALANGLTEVVKVDAKVLIDENTPYMSINVLEDENRTITKHEMEQVQVLMKTTVLALKEVADGYSKFIKIKEMHND